MKFLEKDLEEVIYSTHLKDEDIIFNKGLPFYGKALRQVKLGQYGIADLITYNKNYYESTELNLDNEKSEFNVFYRPIIEITVFELKQNKIGISAFLQCLKYMRGVQRWMKKNKPNVKYKIYGVLVGREIDDSGSFCFIPSIFENIRFFTYDYNFDGIKFNESPGYSFINENL